MKEDKNSHEMRRLGDIGENTPVGKFITTGEGGTKAVKWPNPIPKYKRVSMRQQTLLRRTK